jgi:hypothetical protein
LYPVDDLSLIETTFEFEKVIVAVSAASIHNVQLLRLLGEKRAVLGRILER